MAIAPQAQIVRAFGISGISMKRYVKRYRQSGTAGFFRPRKTRQPRVLMPSVLAKAQELIQRGGGPQRGGPGAGA